MNSRLLPALSVFTDNYMNLPLWCRRDTAGTQVFCPSPEEGQLPVTDLQQSNQGERKVRVPARVCCSLWSLNLPLWRACAPASMHMLHLGPSPSQTLVRRTGTCWAAHEGWACLPLLWWTNTKPLMPLQKASGWVQSVLPPLSRLLYLNASMFKHLFSWFCLETALHGNYP